MNVTDKLNDNQTNKQQQEICLIENINIQKMIFLKRISK